jgi:hypothetical protein
MSPALELFSKSLRPRCFQMQAFRADQVLDMTSPTPADEGQDPVIAELDFKSGAR